MKIQNKFLSAALGIALTMGVVSSCSDDKTVDYVPGTPITGDVAYFPSDFSTTINVSPDAESFQVPVYRGSSEGTLTLDIDVIPLDDDVEVNPYSFDTSVTFADGEKVAYLNVAYDISLIDYDDAMYFELSIDEQHSTPYGYRIIDITVVYPAPWKNLGVGLFTENILFDQAEIPVYVYQNEANPTMFRVFNPFYDILNEDETFLVFQLLENGSTFNFEYNGNIYPLPVEGDDKVGFQLFFVMNDDGLDFYYFMPSMLGSPDSYNYVSEWQDNGLPGIVVLSPLVYNPSEGYWYGDTSASQGVKIIFPDYEKLDTEIEVAYEGILTAPGGMYVQAQVDMGEDLSSVKVGVAGGTNASAIAEGIEDGSIDSVEISASGLVKIPFSSDNESGRYTIVAVGYRDEDVVNSSSLTFNYTAANAPDPNEGWNPLGYVEYTDGFICSMFTVGIVTYEVEIQESKEAPGLYRLVDPYGEAYPYNEPGDYDPTMTVYLEVNATNPNHVSIPFTQTATNWGYGDMYLWSLADYYEYQGATPEEIEEEEVYGSLKDGQITFPAESLLFAMADYENGSFYGANVLVNEKGDDLVYNKDGSLVAPFLIDLNTISKTRSAVAINVVGSPARTLLQKVQTFNPFKKTNKGLNLRKGKKSKAENVFLAR